MKRTMLLLAALLLPICHPAQAQPPTEKEIADVLNRPVHSIKTGVSSVDCVLSLVEIYVAGRDGAGYFLKVDPPAPNGAALRQIALKHERTRGEKTQLILHEVSSPRDAESRIMLKPEIVLQVDKGVQIRALAAGIGAKVQDKLDLAPGVYTLETADSGATLAVLNKLNGMPGVLFHEAVLGAVVNKRFFPTDPLFASQWHLPAINIGPVIQLGTGITIAIVDDGLQLTHPDLTANISAGNSTDILGGDSNPTPSFINNNGVVPGADDSHGTACAGLAAAAFNNGIGGSGAAPRATLAGIRLISGYSGTTNIMRAAAFTFRSNIIHIKSNSWGPPDNGRNLGFTGSIGMTGVESAALQSAANFGRGGLGTVFVWAGGNGYPGDHAGKDPYVNSIYTVGVGALSEFGTRAVYSERGSNLVVSAPGGGFPGGVGGRTIVTTDLVNDDGYNYTARGAADLSDRSYTQNFNGTSAATPIVAGVIALMLEANPSLSWRDVQEVLMRSATKNDALNPEWITNGSGFNFHHDYGAGSVNAQLAVNLASTFTPLGPAAVPTTVTAPGFQPIPDNNTTGVQRSIVVNTGPARVEHVLVTADIPHTFRGDLQLELRSPTGTVSNLVEPHGDPTDNYPASFQFMSVRNWGENPIGTWTLTVKDLVGIDVGTLRNVTLTLHGTGTVGGGGGGGGVADGGVNAGGGSNKGGGSSGGSGTGSGGLSAGGGIVGVATNAGGGSGAGGGAAGGGGSVMGPAAAGGGVAGGAGSAGPAAGGGMAGAGVSGAGR